MALKTKIRLEQVTGSMLQMRPPVFQSRPILQNFNPIDLSGSLGYFSQAIANINGALDFGAQTPGVILHDSANVPTVLLAGAFDGIQSLKLAQRDGTTDDGMKLVFTSTGAHAASTILLNNNAGTGTDSIKVNSTAGGVDIDAKLVLALDGDGGINIGTTADRAIDIDSSTLDIDASGAITLNSTATVLVQGNTSATFGDDTEALVYDGSGNLDLDAVALDIDASGAITMDSTSTILISGDGGATFSDDTEALVYDGSGNVDFDAVALDIDASGAITIDGTSTLSVNAGDDSDITVSTAAKSLILAVSGGGAQKLQLDSAGTGTDSIDISASAGGVDIDATTSVAVNAVTTLVLQGNSSATFGDDTEALAFDGSGNVDFDAVALDIDASGAITIDGATTMVIDSNDDSSWTVTTAAKDLTLGVSGGGAQVLKLDSAGTGPDAIDINATAGSVDVDALLKITLDAADDSNFNVAAAAKGLTLGVSGGGAQVLKLDSAGTGTNAIDINATGGGIDVDAAGAIEIDGVGLSLDSTAASNLTVTTGGAGAIDLAIGITGGGNSSLLLTSDGTGGDAIAINSVAGGVDIKGAALVFSGSTATAINFAGDGSMTSGVGGAGMLFAASADYATLRGNTGMNAGTTVLGAINTLAGQVSGATATIFTGSNQSRAVDGDFTVSKLFGDNTNLVPTCGIAKAQVYVNGQLLVSSSIGGVNDYKITANNTIKFKFAMLPDDLVMVIDRS